MRTKKKKIFLLGAGPGDAELLTLRAVKILSQADCVLYDNLVHPSVLQYCPQAEKISVGKGNGNHLISQAEIHALLEKKINEHACVVRLKGGDPFIFARGGEEIEYLKMRNYDVEVVSGVSAALGAASSIGMALTHRDYASQLIFISGHKRNNNDYRDFSEISLAGKTLVVYMGVSALPQICAALLENSQNKNFSAMLIENATLPQERYVTAKLSEISEKAKQEKISAPAILVVGEVVCFWQNIFLKKHEGAK